MPRLAPIALPALLSWWLLPTSALGQTPPAPPVDPGLYVVVEATQRPLDAVLVLPTVCGAAKKDCELLDQVLANDVRLSCIVRSLKGTPAHLAQVTKTPFPAFTLRPSAAQAAGATYVLAASLKNAKDAANYELTAMLFDARDGKQLSLLDFAVQVAPIGSVRSMAHHVVNGVQGVLTGVQGTFDAIIYFSAKGPECDRCIYQIDADGANRRILVSDKGIHMFPVQLQDGGLMYTSYRNDMWSLFRMDAMQLMALSDLTPTLPKGAKAKAAPKPAPPPVPTPGAPAAPAASATPEAFASGKDLQYRGCTQNPHGDLVATINDGDQADIWQIDWSGQPSRNLSNNPANDLSPSYAPEGDWIAFVSDRSGEPQIYVMRYDGSGQKRLTFSGNYNADPDWGPDGKIAYSGQRGSALDVLTVTMQGKMQRLTPGLGRRSLEPKWSPDGKRVVYVSNEDGKGHRLWIAAADGAAREPIDLVAPSQFYTPNWQRIAGKEVRRWPTAP